jgi:cytochrome c oxidase subunit 2
VPAGPSGNDIDNTVVVTPDRVGDYDVLCTELCGFGHSTMSAFVHVLPAAQFQSWLSKQEKIQANGGGPPAPVTTTGTSTTPSTTTTTTTGTS